MADHELSIRPVGRLPDLLPCDATPPAGARHGGREGVEMASNEDLVASGLRLLRTPLSLHICRGIENEYGDSWWTEGVLEILVHDKTPTVEDVRRYRKLPESGKIEECASSIDISVCLILLTKHWYRIFGPTLGQDERGWAFELIRVRNENKHLVGADHASDFAWRALDTMFRLCDAIDVGIAKEILALRSTVDLSEYGQALGTQVRPVAPADELDSQRGARTPHPREDSIHRIDDALTDELLVAGPDFSSADLQKMNFGGADLDGADFTDANLTDANFHGASLTRATFKNTQLGNANLTEADLTNALFEGGSFAVTRDEGGKHTGLMVAWGADFTGAQLAGATLVFSGCDLRKVNFSGVNLDGADFTDANLTDANLQGATLRGVNLKGANLRDANTTGVRWT